VGGRVREYSVDPVVLDAICTEGMEPYEVAWVSDVVCLRASVFELVHCAVEGLASPYREVIEGCFWERCTYDELGYRLGLVHRSTVLRWKREAIEQLRSQLGRTECRILLTQLYSEVLPRRRDAESLTS
jgi:DNA-directed RNA polymerase specialized sigma24 family protein